jgi:hypothetical protein
MMVTGYQRSKAILDSDPYYLDCRKKTIADFPAMDCPQEYKEAICSLSGGEQLLEYLQEPLGALGNRSILQVLQSKDYAVIEAYIHECVTLDIAGPGAL